MPKIEKAYGVEVYTHALAQLDGALDRIREHCATLHMDVFEVIKREILAIRAPEAGAQ